MDAKSPNPLLKETKQPPWYITYSAELSKAIIHGIRISRICNFPNVGYKGNEEYRLMYSMKKTESGKFSS